MTFPKEGYSIPMIYIKFYKKLMKSKLSKKYWVDLVTYRNILYLFNKKLTQALLDGAIIILPYNLGDLRIKKRKGESTTASPDFTEYRKSGLKTVHMNLHSERFRSRLYWRKGDAMGLYPYSLEFMWHNGRKLSAQMKKVGGHKNYME